MTLASKARTLENLGKVLHSANILPQIRFNIEEYKNNKNNIILRASKLGDKLIVRSSSATEDGDLHSKAGEYESVLNVSNTTIEIDNAIKRVIKSYRESINNKDEIFVQPMLKNVDISGVVFSRDIDTLAPYFVINYDVSGDTEAVTSGTGKNLKTQIIYRDTKNINDVMIEKLVNTVKEIEIICKNTYLDIEFAFSKGELYIFQVRCIVRHNKHDLSGLDIKESLNKLYKKIEKLNSAHPKLLGDKSIYSIMTDWNPAEIIGVKPKRLAISLYKEIITDEIWAYQRDNYGYRNLRSFPLMVSFLGLPYIDVRVSLESFIPKNLHNDIARKLISYYLDSIKLNTQLHDKVEFEIIFSCYYFGIDKRLEILKDNGFNSNEIKRLEYALLEITNNIINKESLFYKDIEKSKILESKYEEVVNSNLSIIDKIYWLNEDVKRYGTLPFAGVARAAFMGTQILESLVRENIISNNQKIKFLKSINTISRELTMDIASMPKCDFISKYGHLRPGTYDITSKTYRENYELYFGKEIHGATHCRKYTFNKKIIQRIDRLLIENGIKIDAIGLIDFIKESIRQREYVKFIFTRSLSKILDLIEELGGRFGFGVDEMAYVDFAKIKSLYATLDHREVVDILRNDISKNKAFYNYTLCVKLPSVITSPDDIFYFFQNDDAINYIGTSHIVCETVIIDNSTDIKLIRGKIALIKAADPGYDYLFSCGIVGLVTAFGGVNSHMAVRCSEIGIPAMIGCGIKIYDKISTSKVLRIDATNKQYEIIR